MSKLAPNHSHQIFTTVLAGYAESALLALYEATEWPEKSDILSWVNREGVSFLSSGRTFGLRPLPEQEQEREIQVKAREKFWLTLFSKYQVGLGDLSKSILPSWILADGFQSAFNELVKNSPAETVATFLSRKTDHGVQGSTAHDRSTLLQDLVSFGYLDVLKAVDAVWPDWIKEIDKKGRTVAFFAREPKTLEFLLEKKVDLTVKNDKGQTAENYWLEAKLPKQALLIQTLSEKSSDYSTSMASKLVSGRLDFTDEEKEVFEQAQTDKKWTWTGRLQGIERTWSFAEIVKMSELMMAIGAVNHTGMNDYYTKYYGTVSSRPQEVIKVLQKFRKDLGASSAWVFDPKRSQSMFENALEYMIEARDSKDQFIIHPTHATTTYYNTDAMNKLQVRSAERFLNALPINQRDDFNKEMVLLLRSPWANFKDLSAKKHVYMLQMCLPLSEKGYATPSFAQAMAEDRQKEGLRHPDLLSTIGNKWANDLDQLVNRFQSSSNPQEWKEPMLIVLCACGSAGSLLTKHELEVAPPKHQKVQKTLASVLSQRDVGISNIPVRWTKNYCEDLEAVASKWSLETIVEKRLSKKPAPLAPAPRRKM